MNLALTPADGEPVPDLRLSCSNSATPKASAAPPAASPGPFRPRWTTVRFRTWRCPMTTLQACGQLSDFLRGTVQRGWKLPWNQGVHCNHPIGGDFPRFQVQLDRIGQSATNSKSLYTGMTPHRPVQILCPIRGDARDTTRAPTAPTQADLAAGTVARQSQH